MIQADSTFASIWSALGAAVAHFLWQGALIGLVCMGVLWCLERRSAASRYAVASAALALCLVAFATTFATMLAGTEGANVLKIGAAGGAVGLAPGVRFELAHIAAWCWAAGALAMAVRFTGQCYGVHTLKVTDVCLPERHWRRSFEQLKRQLGVARGVRLLQSGLAEVPMVVGWLSPVVLVPASAFTALSPDQLRSLLAHELAHIRRYDHWLNAAQAVVEIVLFFHPAVWWISKQVRLEREYCCDDSSLRLMGDPRVIAEALAAVEALRIAKPNPGAVLASNGGPLMQRISRILGLGQEPRSLTAHWQLPAGLLLAGIVTLAGNAFADASLQDRVQVNGERIEQKRTEQEQRADREAEYKALSQDLEAAVKAGQLSREDAGKKLAAERERLFGKKTKISRRRTAISVEKYKQIEADIKKAVEDGKLSREDANKKLEEMRRSIDGQQREEDLLRRIELAVKNGEMTREEAQKKIQGLRDELAQRKAANSAARYEVAVQRVEESIKAGKMTPEEGKKLLEGYRKRLGSPVTAERFVGKEQPKSYGSMRRTAITKEAYEKAEADLKKAVEDGKVKPEDARRRLAEMRAALKQRQVEEQLENVLAQIDRAVAAGTLTPEQAREKIEAHKQRMKASEKRKAEEQRARDEQERSDEAAGAKQKSTSEPRERRL